LGAVVFGIGWMLASFHCSGTVDVTGERLRLLQLYTEKPGQEAAQTHSSKSKTVLRPI